MAPSESLPVTCTKYQAKEPQHRRTKNCSQDSDTNPWPRFDMALKCDFCEKPHEPSTCPKLKENPKEFYFCGKCGHGWHFKKKCWLREEIDDQLEQYTPDKYSKAKKRRDDLLARNKDSELDTHGSSSKQPASGPLISAASMNLSGLKNNLPGQSSRQNQQPQSQRQIQTQGQPSAVSREETQQQREKIEAAIAIKNANREKWTQASLSLAAYPSLHEIPPAGPNSIKANFFHVTIDPDDFDLRGYHVVFKKMLGRDSKGNITYRDVVKPELKREIINKMLRKNVPITAYATDYFCYIISVGRLYDDFGDNVGNTVTKSHMCMSGNVEFPSLAMSNRVVYDRHVNVAELRRFINRDSERDVGYHPGEDLKALNIIS